MATPDAPIVAALLASMTFIETPAYPALSPNITPPMVTMHEAEHAPPLALTVCEVLV